MYYQGTSCMNKYDKVHDASSKTFQHSIQNHHSPVPRFLSNELGHAKRAIWAILIKMLIFLFSEGTSF